MWIVDDSRTEAAITQRSLGGEFQFEYFGDGTTVVERISSSTQLPDLLLLDWVMPGMTGDEVCRFLRSRPQTRDLPIIMVTASRVETDDVVAGLAIGANDYVPRPFAPEELRARVNAALRTKQLSDLATRERQRLTTINRLGHALLQTLGTRDQIVSQLADALTANLCDGCSVLMLPGTLPTTFASRHRHEPSGEQLARISSLADPAVHAFTSSDQARSVLPPAYADYITRFGLRGLAILPFPIVDPIRGVVTVTRDGDSEPFDTEDIATIETCIEHASLAIERVMRAEAERAARTQLDTVLGSLPVGLVATDEQGVIALVNQAAHELLPAIEIGHSLSELFALPGWADSVGAPLADPSAVVGASAGSSAGVRLNVDLQLQLPGEPTPRTIAVTAVPVRGSGNDLASVVVFEDVSADRAIAAERERIGRFQQEMLAIVGHDLRSPLNAIFAGAELLQLELPPDKLPGKTVRRIHSSANRMARIIEQLLDVTHARLGAGIPVAPQDASLRPIVDDVVGELALAHPDTKFELTGTTEIRGVWDPDRLQQVVSNLVSNAAQYGRPGAPVSIEVTREGSNALLTVRNEIRDAPISADTLPVLFQPYRRGKTTVHTTGLGLGLYIVHEIVRAHHGTIDVESTTGGTVFKVTLPVEPERKRL